MRAIFEYIKAKNMKSVKKSSQTILALNLCRYVNFGTVAAVPQLRINFSTPRLFNAEIFKKSRKLFSSLSGQSTSQIGWVCTHCHSQNLIKYFTLKWILNINKMKIMLRFVQPKIYRAFVWLSTYSEDRNSPKYIIINKV